MKKLKRYSVRLIDEHTGETIMVEFRNHDLSRQTMTAFEGHADAIDRASRNLNRRKDKDWLKLMMSAAKKWPESIGRNHSFSTVLIVMCSDVAYGGRIKLTEGQIAERAFVSTKTVRRAVDHLVAEGLISRGIHEGRSYLFMGKSLGMRGYSQLESTQKIVDAEKARAKAAHLTVIQGGKKNEDAA